LLKNCARAIPSWRLERWNDKILIEEEEERPYVRVRSHADSEGAHLSRGSPGFIRCQSESRGRGKPRKKKKKGSSLSCFELRLRRPGGEHGKRRRKESDRISPDDHIERELQERTGCC